MDAHLGSYLGTFAPVSGVRVAAFAGTFTGAPTCSDPNEVASVFQVTPPAASAILVDFARDNLSPDSAARRTMQTHREGSSDNL